MAGIFTGPLENPELDAILGDAAQAAAMVEVERALARVQGRLGAIPAEAAAAIDAGLARFVPDLADLARGTTRDGVPVPALVTALRRALPEPAAGFVHHGATSQDIADTALVLQLRAALGLIETRLAALGDDLAGLADDHAATPTIARTRWQQAVPTVFGLKVAGWLAPLARHRQRLRELRPRLLVLQFGGAAGNLAALGEQGVAVMEELAGELDLGCPAMPWHAQRDGLVELGAWTALVTGSLGKLGQDLLLLAQNEVGEVRDARGGGSSAMPHKANPVRAEALVTIARRQSGLLATMHDAMLHAHERDGAAWALEWATLPAMVSGAGAALRLAGDLLPDLVIDTGRMRANLDAAQQGWESARPAAAALLIERVLALWREEAAARDAAARQAR